MSPTQVPNLETSKQGPTVAVETPHGRLYTGLHLAGRRAGCRPGPRAGFGTIIAVSLVLPGSCCGGAGGGNVVPLIAEVSDFRAVLLQRHVSHDAALGHRRPVH